MFMIVNMYNIVSIIIVYMYNVIYLKYIMHGEAYDDEAYRYYGQYEQIGCVIHYSSAQAADDSADPKGLFKNFLPVSKASFKKSAPLLIHEKAFGPDVAEMDASTTAVLPTNTPVWFDATGLDAVVVNNGEPSM